MKTGTIASGALLVAVAVAALAANGWQRAQVRLARAEAERLREVQRTAAALRAENERLAAAQATAEERAEIAARQAETQRWRERVAVLNRKWQEPVGARAAKAATVELPERNWRYVGWASPTAALETALWAVAGGEVELLAGRLVLDDAARKRAEALLAGLPETARLTYRTPERLVALLAAKDAPSGSARVVGETPRGENEVALRVRLDDDGKDARVANLVVRRAADGWKFVVPERAVARYAEMLQAPGGS